MCIESIELLAIFHGDTSAKITVEFFPDDDDEEISRVTLDSFVEIVNSMYKISREQE